MIALRFGAGLTVPEIARVIGERRTTAEGRLYRGLTRMRDELAPKPVLKASPIRGRRAAACGTLSRWLRATES